MRWLIRLALLVIALLGLSVAGFVIYFDHIARVGIERGGSYALGVETTLSGVRLRPLAGRIGLYVLRVSSPAGFGRPNFLNLAEARGEVDVSTLRAPVIVNQGLGKLLGHGKSDGD